MRVPFWLGLSLLVATAQGEEPKKSTKPGVIQLQELREGASLTGKRKALVEAALALAANPTWFPYRYSAESPEEGGFDCSGATFYLMKKVGIDPPRNSQAQYDWLKESGRLVPVPATTKSGDEAALAKLKPGDLIFWTHTTTANTGPIITHVQMFLGHEINGGKPVMAGASDGRTYHGTRRSGYGVYDFRLPAKDSKARLIAYGTPPGVN